MFFFLNNLSVCGPSASEMKKSRAYVTSFSLSFFKCEDYFVQLFH